jgi:hypothetical protein
MFQKGGFDAGPRRSSLRFPTLTVSISFDFYHRISFCAACKGMDGLAGVFPGRFRLIAREMMRQICVLTEKQNQCTNIANNSQLIAIMGGAESAA